MLDVLKHAIMYINKHLQLKTLLKQYEITKKWISYQILLLQPTKNSALIVSS